MILVWHLIFQDHSIEFSCDLMCLMQITLTYDPARFRGHRLSGTGDIIYLVCHLI